MSQAQTEQPQIPNFDDLDLDIDFDEIFGMLDSLDINLGGLGDIDELISEQFGDLSEDKEMLNQLLQQGMKTIQEFDMGEIQGLMDNFMKDFGELHLEEKLDLEELEKIVDEHSAKRRKI